MNSYNGYTPHQRMKAFNWLKEQWACGKRQQKPNCCDICSQTDGILDYHSENYSSPFGDHIGAFGLCYICHMMLHCRFKNPKTFQIYLESLKQKKMYEPYHSRNWNAFRKDCLIDRFENMRYEKVKQNNYELYKDMSLGLYANSLNAPHKRSVGI